MKLNRGLIALVLLLVLVVTTGGIWNLICGASVQRQVLPDGSVVVLKGVTYGRQHRLPAGTLLQRIVGRLLPSDFARRFGIPMLTYTTTNDSMIVWWELTDLPKAGNSLYSIPELVIADDQGNEFAASDFTIRYGVTTPSQGGVFGLIPRGNERLSIRMRFSDLIARTDGSVAFNVRNPAPRIDSRWQAHSLPATSRLDEVEIVLTDLSPSIPFPGEDASLAGWMTASARFSVAGRSSTDWQLCGVEVFDEAGGNYRPGVGALRVNMNDGSLRFRGSLSSTKVWKLRFAVCQVGGFRSNQVTIFRDVPLEGLARATFAPRSNNVNGVTLNLFDVTTGRPRCLNLMTMPPDDEVTVVLSEAIDEQGQRHDVRFIGPRFSRRGRSHGYASFPMDQNLRSKSVDATFGISRLRYVEMLVRPSDSPAKSSSAFPPPTK